VAAVRHRVVLTTLGPLTLVGERDRLTGVYYPGHWAGPDPAGFGPAAPTAFEDAARQLGEYLAGERRGFDLRAGPRGGSPLRRAIWDAIAEIPYGQTRTYLELAERAGTHPRAVGGAVAHNPLSIIVPCHRVVGTDGSLTGYAGGLERKRRLLTLEGALP
jgi:methylated-DNA-[protein]-cysteine S-methyltransferase